MSETTVSTNGSITVSAGLSASASSDWAVAGSVGIASKPIWRDSEHIETNVALGLNEIRVTHRQSPSYWVSSGWGNYAEYKQPERYIQRVYGVQDGKLALLYEMYGKMIAAHIDWEDSE